VQAHPHALRKVLVAQDIDRAKAQGQVGVIYGFQNTEMLGDSVQRVADFAARGVRVIQLTYNGRNRVGCGAVVADDTGLSRFGAELVERLQHEGVLVDLSHSSERTCLDALSLAARRHGDARIAKVLGGNFRRVMAAAWGAGASAQEGRKP
jgi:membrane dipeptidase